MCMWRKIICQRKPRMAPYGLHGMGPRRLHVLSYGDVEALALDLTLMEAGDGWPWPLALAFLTPGSVCVRCCLLLSSRAFSSSYFCSRKRSPVGLRSMVSETLGRMAEEGRVVVGVSPSLQYSIFTRSLTLPLWLKRSSLWARVCGAWCSVAPRTGYAECGRTSPPKASVVISIPKGRVVLGIAFDSPSFGCGCVYLTS